MRVNGPEIDLFGKQFSSIKDLDRTRTQYLTARCKQRCHRRLIRTQAPIFFLTKRQFEARVQQHQVQGGVFGAADLIVRHDDLRVQREPLPRTLLHTERRTEEKPERGGTFQPSSSAFISFSCAADGTAMVGEPHWTGGCCGGESTRCPPWCPRLTLCSTPQPSDPGPDD